MNQNWQHRKAKVITRGQGNLFPLYISHARNAQLWDEEGKMYIDFGSGIAVCNTGHSHPKVVAAATEQLQKLSHACLMITPYGVAVELAEQLVELIPINGDKKLLFVTTGAEAVENAIKIARSHTKRRAVVSFQGGFHGRTNLTMALTGKVAPYKMGFGPLASDIYHVPFPMTLHNVTTSQSLAALQNLFKSTIAASDVAAIIIEPIQGEGGFYPAPIALLQALRALCDEHGILLIADEIQTGFARTGRMFAIEHSGVEPDLITIAKGIAGGLPLAAVAGKAHIMDAPMPGGLGGTYGGSPVACAAALAVLDVIRQERLVERADSIGSMFKEQLTQLQQRYPDYIAEIRQVGAMIALEFATESTPLPDILQRITSLAPQYGLVLLPCGYYSNVLRFLPPLTIELDVLMQGLAQLDILFEHALSAD